MIINSITIRNFKSYGNNLQKLSFPDNNSIILLKGKNANGKSSLLESIDYALYNIVRGKNTKRVPNYILPNRKNKNLETEINFKNWNDQLIKINRKLNPKGFEIYIDNINRTNDYDLMTQQEKDDIIGLEYSTYKSLISLNLADFANFINLDTDTKKKLLNKLFNIEEMDNYLSITKELLKNAYKRKEKIEDMILSSQNTLNTYKNNIQVILEKTGGIDKEQMKEKMNEYKNEFISLKNDIKELKELLHPIYPEIKSKVEILNAKKNKIYEDEFTLKELSNKMEIFNQGHCPFCETKLNDYYHKKKLDKLNLLYEESKNDIIELKKGFSLIKNELTSKTEEKNKLLKELNDKEIRHNILKEEINDLKKEYNKTIESVSINELYKNIETIENELIKYNKGIDKIDEKIVKYEKLVDILSERGIRRGLIGTIVDPINEHLANYLVELESPYRVKLDDSFDAVIKERFTEDVHIESLSTGEARKINVAIALSYLETLMSMNKKTNILFLDEVFASVDPDNIDLMLGVLRNFSIRNNINVIIVNHSSFDTTKFDRVISIEKKFGYSMIVEN